MSLLEEIKRLSPDLICLTEAWKDSLDRFGGHIIASCGAPWSPQDADERRVLLWSPAPWTQVEHTSDFEKIGSLATGWTRIAGKEVRVVGVCIPYPFASPFEQSPRAPQWRMHERFVEQLMPRLRNWSAEGPLIVVGDFNRRIPRAWGSKRAYQLLIDALGDLSLATAGPVSGLEDQVIDHVAFNNHLRTINVFGRTAASDDGRERSDHPGIVVDFDHV